MKLRAASDEPLVEVSVVDSLGESHVFKPDKAGLIDVPDDFQEVLARLREAGFSEPTSESEEDD